MYVYSYLSNTICQRRRSKLLLLEQERTHPTYRRSLVRRKGSFWTPKANRMGGPIVSTLVAIINFSPCTFCFPLFSVHVLLPTFMAFHSQLVFRNKNAKIHTITLMFTIYCLRSQHSNHIHIFTSITRVLATKVSTLVAKVWRAIYVLALWGVYKVHSGSRKFMNLSA